MLVDDDWCKIIEHIIAEHIYDIPCLGLGLDLGSRLRVYGLEFGV
jgi:hypothetical protein